MDFAQEKTPVHVLAEDEATLYLQATLTRVWAPRGQPPPVWVDPGRQKTCFYGTLDLHTGRCFVTQAETMNSALTAEHLELILRTLPEGKILLLWDRAPWHGGEAVAQVLAQNPRLEILKFPVAAPDLNPQEKVWKAARQTISHNHRFAQLPDLGAAFQQYLETETFPCNMLDVYGFNAVRPMFE